MDTTRGRNGVRKNGRWRDNVEENVKSNLKVQENKIDENDKKNQLLKKERPTGDGSIPK